MAKKAMGRPPLMDDGLTERVGVRLPKGQIKRLKEKKVDISEVCRAALAQKLKGPLPKKAA